jgi:hypothetical protein
MGQHCADHQPCVVAVAAALTFDINVNEINRIREVAIQPASSHVPHGAHLARCALARGSPFAVSGISPRQGISFASQAG